MSASGRRRVVITGLGAVTPLGNDVRASWEQLVAGRGAAGPITAFDTTDFAVAFACEAKDFEPTRWIERKQARRGCTVDVRVYACRRMTGHRSRVASPTPSQRPLL